MKTSIKDIPLANDKLITEVARLNKTTKGEVKEVIDFVGSYIAGVIKEGTLEGVMIPYFGKFKPKERKLVAVNMAVRNKASGKDMIYSAVKGKTVIDRRKLKKPDETIRH